MDHLKPRPYRGNPTPDLWEWEVSPLARSGWIHVFGGSVTAESSFWCLTSAALRVSTMWSSWGSKSWTAQVSPQWSLWLETRETSRSFDSPHGMFSLYWWRRTGNVDTWSVRLAITGTSSYSSRNFSSAPLQEAESKLPASACRGHCTESAAALCELTSLEAELPQSYKDTAITKGVQASMLYLRSSQSCAGVRKPQSVCLWDKGSTAKSQTSEHA